MRSNKLAGTKPTISVQKYLDISEIKKDCIVLKDGSMRAVILVSSINFGLKSEDEQIAVIQNYVNFLNTLEWPIQIVIQSRKLDITAYLEDLRKREREQTNELLKTQMSDYIDYVKELVELGEIMTKKFFIVVSYNPISDKKRGFFDRLTEVFMAPFFIRLKGERFEKYREELFKRVDQVLSALSQMGLKGVPLNTQSLIELFYNTYNPITSQNQKLVEVEKLRIEE